MNNATASGAMLRAATPYGFLLPALLVTALVILFPVLQTAWYSLHEYVLYDPGNFRFIGLRNFATAFSDEVFWIALLNSAIWVSGIVLLQLLLGLGAALLLNQSFWWRGMARALVIIPWALPSVIIGLMWTWIYDFNLGVLNDILLRIGLISAPHPWLAQPSTALACIMLALVWQGFPFFTVTILAGLQTVPHELYEAAEIDGASPWRQFLHVTLPSIAGIVATAVLLRIIWVANSLDVILVMTGGGPGYATHTLPLYAFLRAYTGMEFGYAASLSLMLTAILLGIVWLYVRRQAGELER
ncbi:MAG: sugar ABC transporter permease [Bosea sp.]|uniref:carbohydrate ABC transporter permease n=1 Tax=unclassified Bosea (in: a-proteobacteria) TaxID=2653178 RepID=UPI000A3E89F2|nr:MULTISPECIES: sugar ABC transporter permease [unclassified Bosea (in: a-proteobacteria)]MBN9458064.1 sugar ABC transporter permease [Bosea sp. (in: a-proteobacteria)]